MDIEQYDMDIEQYDVSPLQENDMGIDQCTLCSSYSMLISDLTERGFSLSGRIMIYKRQSKNYAKKCCWLNYVIGGLRNDLVSNGVYLRLLEKLKTLPSKILIDEQGKHWDVYELKCKYKIDKTITAASKQFSKIERSSITLVYPLSSYNIYTPCEYKRLSTKKKNESIYVPSADAINDIDMLNNKFNGYIYLLKDRTAMVTNANIYKVGKTTQLNFNRFKGYPIGYKIFLHRICPNCHEAEKKILALFRSKYNSRKDFGSETFEGDLDSMIADINYIISSMSIDSN